MAATDTAAQTARCLRCGRKIKSGLLGAKCAAKIRAALKVAELSPWTASQVEDARQAIEDGAVVPSTREGVFHVVSSDGTEVYRTHRNGCVCTNGLKTRQPRPCWHRCAVAIMTASQAPAAGLPTAPVALPGGTAPVAADILSVLADDLSAGGDILPVLSDVWTVLESMGALAGAAAPF